MQTLNIRHLNQINLIKHNWSHVETIFACRTLRIEAEFQKDALLDGINDDYVVINKNLCNTIVIDCNS